MAIIKHRLPSRSEAWLLFIACAFVVNVWSIFNLLRWMPSLLGHLKPVEILVVFSYTQVFALIESIVVFVAILLIGFILPQGALRDHWIAKGSIIVFITGLWTVGYHYFADLLSAWRDFVDFLYPRLGLQVSEVGLLTAGFAIMVIAWITSYIIVLRRLYARIRQKEAFADRIHNLVERLAVLTLLYLASGLLGGIVVLIRNL